MKATLITVAEAATRPGLYEFWLKEGGGRTFWKEMLRVHEGGRLELSSEGAPEWRPWELYHGPWLMRRVATTTPRRKVLLCEPR